MFTRRICTGNSFLWFLSTIEIFIRIKNILESQCMIKMWCFRMFFFFRLFWNIFFNLFVFFYSFLTFFLMFYNLLFMIDSFSIKFISIKDIFSSILFHFLDEFSSNHVHLFHQKLNRNRITSR